jgi:hypothetical protein
LPPKMGSPICVWIMTMPHATIGLARFNSAELKRPKPTSRRLETQSSRRRGLYAPIAVNRALGSASARWN